MRREPETWIACAITAAAALRVLVFAAAFPFFSPVDEHWHVDTVLKYARGYLPRPVTDDYEPEMAVLFATFATSEYHVREHVYAERGVEPPGWSLPPADLEIQIREMRERFAGMRNFDAYQPPVYYAAAGAWMRVGRALGLEGGWLLYWVRALNALLVAVLVGASWLFLRREYPENRFVRLGVPVLLAVLPQDALYQATPDALSPTLVGVGLLTCVALARRPASRTVSWAALGVVGAAAVLTKYTNAMLLVPFAIASALVWRARPPGAARKLLALWLAAALPVAAWSARNQALFDDPTASAVKVERLGWKPRPAAELLDHPLFTPQGPVQLLSRLAPTFWRGELAWHRVAMADDRADRFYAVSSLLALLLAGAALLRREDRQRSRWAEGASLATLVAAVALLAALSLCFRFPRLGNPSAALPFFTEGRLVSGALLPFALLYVRGLQVASRTLPARLRTAASWLELLVAVAVVLVSEIALSLPVFASEFNAYHLP